MLPPRRALLRLSPLPPVPTVHHFGSLQSPGTADIARVVHPNGVLEARVLTESFPTTPQATLAAHASPVPQFHQFEVRALPLLQEKGVRGSCSGARPRPTSPPPRTRRT